MKKTFTSGRYLVTGGAGFIGSHLCERLLALGNQVICLDNFITGRRENILPFLRDSNFTLIEHDLIQPIEIEGGLAGIFHMASPASPVDYVKFPIETLRVGSLGSDHALQIAKKQECPILVASTSEVYGDPLQNPQEESYWGNVNPVGPRGCYDESKRYLEALTMAYHRVHGVKTRIVRIFNTYGPRMRTNDGRVIPNFCIQAIENRPLTVYGEGTQTRSFCYVDDLVDGLLRLIGKDHVNPVNLGNPHEMTVLQLAKKILELSKSPSKIEFKPLPVDDPKVRNPNISKAQTLLDWKPQVGLDEGLKRTYNFFLTQVQIAPKEISKERSLAEPSCC